MSHLEVLKIRLIFNISFFLSIGILISQPIPKNSFNYFIKSTKYDLGQDWESHSIIRSFRLWDLNINKSNNLFHRNYFFNWNEQGGNFIFNSNYIYKKNFFAYMSFHMPLNLIFNEENKNLEQKKINQSGFGYQNDWFLFQLCRGTQNYGAGNEIALVLNDSSNPYDYFMIYSNYGKIRVNYIHGLLEKRSSNNRYINARGLEWTNNKSLSLGISETIIYSGENRAMDIGYLNPIASHLEVELNNRLNIVGSSSANAVWQIHGDIKSINDSKISFNLLIDEFVLDREYENQKNKEQAKAYSFKFNFPIFSASEKVFYIFCSSIYVGTSTLRHNDGFNNFVNASKPLGWEYGSDGIENQIGFNYHIYKKSLGMMSLGKIKIGEESINQRSYEPYKDNLRGAFPSGEVTTKYVAKVRYILKVIAGMDLYFSSVFEHSKDKNKISNLAIGFSFVK